MKLLYCIFFGAGVAAFAYTRMGRRVGYGNQANVWTIVGVTFIVFTLFFYTVATFFLPTN